MVLFFSTGQMCSYFLSGCHEFAKLARLNVKPKLILEVSKVESHPRTFVLQGTSMMFQGSSFQVALPSMPEMSQAWSLMKYLNGSSLDLRAPVSHLPVNPK